MSLLSDALLFPLFPSAWGCTPRSAVRELQEAESGGAEAGLAMWPGWGPCRQRRGDSGLLHPRI